MIQAFLFILGAIIGSFLNVVALRWGKKSVGGRSACPTCGTTLSWFELVPVMSFIFQRGKCRSCNAKISWQYLLIEILSGLVFVSLYYVSGLTAYYLLLTTVFCVYIVILIYDARHKIIPDPLVYTSIFIGLNIPLFIIHYSLFDWLAGPLLFAFFGSIWFLSRGRAMGFGDAKLGLSVGLLLGAAQGLSAIILAFWMGAAFSLAYMILHKTGFLKSEKGLTMKSEVPFAPFIILGAWVSLVFGLDILNVSSL